MRLMIFIRFSELGELFSKELNFFGQVDINFFLLGNQPEELNWCEFETVNSCYPSDFAKAIAEVCIFFVIYPVLAEEK